MSTLISWDITEENITNNDNLVTFGHVSNISNSIGSPSSSASCLYLLSEIIKVHKLKIYIRYTSKASTFL